MYRRFLSAFLTVYKRKNHLRTIYLCSEESDQTEINIPEEKRLRKKKKSRSCNKTCIQKFN